MNEIVKKNGINYGIITGVLSVLTTTLIYVIDLKLFTSTWLGFLSIAIYIIIGVVLLSKTRKDFKGSLAFKDAFTTYFVSAVIGILISVVFNIILFNYIDPSAKATIKELTMKYTVEMLQKFDTPAKVINETIKSLEENDQFAPLKLLQGSVFSIIFSALFGLVLAAFFKTKSSFPK
ncbi:DUF4199 domain-containing protein [Flavobacterium psychrophilum]|uniref:DUF4199 domain-containing protein n=2 Tax=Flavobacterium psychrophilum TaxID=96345 RepID=A6GYQ0_FLAPJ|nr:DUF4199 domain-containing protein [Flavobacterium psychrophilum]AIG29935.1 hypothetical protein IA03_05395 [Flavobacterium psychrophilum]AIG32212.1 hypothetical protein IA01_05400 [Flavobacterium psychrophilum]AIG34368.1 hypothetical protein IA02_04815 [Flavobacterium psychrophilum]AIG36731.1 hypothetical protein IA04_05305 [Flavobacterium psychrophilum]AIG38995.1 hypothetical protein IA05_05395 [Flavobacterium psychrophilum]